MNYPKLIEWLAGDPVLFAPVSTRIPCKQGILQGKLLLGGPDHQFRNRKLLRHSDYLSNSLSWLTGKEFQRTGNFGARTANAQRPATHSKRSGSASKADLSRQCLSRAGLQPEVGPCPTAPPLVRSTRMSAIPPKADIRSRRRHVANGANSGSSPRIPARVSTMATSSSRR